MKTQVYAAAIAVLLIAAPTTASEIVLKLTGTEPITRQAFQYQCDSKGVKLGLPKGPFAVEYINGAGNSLAMVPISGKTLIFVNVTSGSGARYVAHEYTWWDAGGRGASLGSETLGGKTDSACRRVE